MHQLDACSRLVVSSCRGADSYSLGCGQGYDKRGYPQHVLQQRSSAQGNCVRIAAHISECRVRYAWAENPWYGRYFELPCFQLEYFA